MRKIIICMFILSMFSGCKRVSPGYEGIQVNMCADKEENAVKALPIGRHFEGYCEEIYTYPLYKNRYVFTMDEKEGSPNNEEICANDKDGMKHCFDVGVIVRTTKGKAGQVFASFRSYKDDMQAIIKGPAFDVLRDSFNQVVRKYKAAEVYATKKGEIRDRVREMFAKRLSKDGLSVDEITLNGYRPPKSVEAAIDAKVRVDEESAKARAEAERVRAEEVKKTITAEEQAKRAKIKADAEAYVKITSSEAEAKANEKITRSLTKELIEYTKWSKWNGELPKVSSGGTPLINLK